MSYDFEESSSQRIEFPSYFDFTTKMSFSFWYKAESNPATHQTQFIVKGKSGTMNDCNFVILWTPAGGGLVYYSWSQPTTQGNEWATAFSPTLATWMHWYGEIDWTTNPDAPSLWIDNSSKSMYFNGYGVNNADPLTTATQIYSLGGPLASTNYADGKLAEIGVWDRFRSTEERALLTAGYSPNHFTDGLKVYIPLKDNAINLINGATGTLINTPVLSTDHPPKMSYPSKIARDFTANQLRPKIFTPGMAR